MNPLIMPDALIYLVVKLCVLFVVLMLWLVVTSVPVT